MDDPTRNSRSIRGDSRHEPTDISNMKSFIERGDLPDALSGAIRRASKLAPVMGETYVCSQKGDTFRSIQFGTADQTDNQTLDAMVEIAKAALRDMENEDRSKTIARQIRTIYETEGKEAATDALFRMTQTRGTSIVHAHLN